MDPRLHLIHSKDNVVVALEPLSKDMQVMIDGWRTALSDNVRVGSKIARNDIPAGSDVFKYGMPIGRAVKPIVRGELVHTHNLVSNYTSADSRLPGRA
jgi:altronate hydrolase